MQPESEIRIVHGRATPEELAAITAVLYAVARSRAATHANQPAKSVVLRWPTNGRAHHPPGAWTAGPGPWWGRAA
ncbi:acyl-CoA carboxylase subunit epsilon [Streptomyces rimosus]|uniref:acyl-CoA carboxylase subunit epsilon n=1 Tax=Streptomyces rimosus TaxID=1927 RepID=UPI00099BC584|nr:acyl-CoA carboxylase subunit epsilon [Streptomyces rimosus]